jgi:hypothetical protein
VRLPSRLAKRVLSSSAMACCNFTVQHGVVAGHDHLRAALQLHRSRHVGREARCTFALLLDLNPIQSS